MRNVAIDHIKARTSRLSSGRYWLPAVYSERDAALRADLIEELGEPIPSSYMSEHTGWEIEPADYDLQEED